MKRWFDPSPATDWDRPEAEAQDSRHDRLKIGEAVPKTVRRRSVGNSAALHRLLSPGHA